MNEKKKPKIAVLYCGQPRLIEPGFGNHAKRWISDEFDVDVYAHFWNQLPAFDNKRYANTTHDGEEDGKNLYIDYFDESEYTIMKQRGDYDKSAILKPEAVIKRFFDAGKELNIKNVVVEDFYALNDPMFVKFFHHLQKNGNINHTSFIHYGVLGVYHAFQIAIGQYMSFAKAIEMIPNLDEYDAIYKVRTDLAYGSELPISIKLFENTYDYNNVTYGMVSENDIIIMPNIEIAAGRIAHLDVWTYCKPGAAKKFSDTLLGLRSELFDDQKDFERFIDIVLGTKDNILPWQHAMWDYYFKKAGVWGVGEYYINFGNKDGYNTCAPWAIIRPGGVIKLT